MSVNVLKLVEILNRVHFLNELWFLWDNKITVHSTEECIVWRCLSQEVLTYCCCCLCLFVSLLVVFFVLFLSQESS